MQKPFIPYEGNEKCIFVSYSHLDSAKVYPIIKGLHDKGFRIWYDEGIEWGNEWPDAVAKHVRTCSHFLAFVSKNYTESIHCKQELTRAENYKKPIYAVMLDQYPLPEGLDMQLGVHQKLDFSKFKTNEEAISYMANQKSLQACKGFVSSASGSVKQEKNPPTKYELAHELDDIFVGSYFDDVEKKSPPSSAKKTTSRSRKKKKRKKGRRANRTPYICLAIFLILALGVFFGVRTIKSRNKALMEAETSSVSVERTMDNKEGSMYRGDFLSSEKYEYYCYDNIIYKKNRETGKIKKIKEYFYGSDLALKDGWIYYFEYTNLFEGICRIDVNGKNEEQLLELRDKVGHEHRMIIIGEDMYYYLSADDAIYKISLEELTSDKEDKTPEVFAENLSQYCNFTADGEALYYSKQGGLVKKYLSDGTEETIMADNSIEDYAKFYDFLIEDSTLYYEGPYLGEMHSIKTDGTNNMLINTEAIKNAYDQGYSVSSSNVVDGQIYLIMMKHDEKNDSYKSEKICKLTQGDTLEDFYIPEDEKYEVTSIVSLNDSLYTLLYYHAEDYSESDYQLIKIN